MRAAASAGIGFALLVADEDDDEEEAAASSSMALAAWVLEAAVRREAAISMADAPEL